MMYSGTNSPPAEVSTRS